MVFNQINNRISILLNDVTMIDKDKQTPITTHLVIRFALALLKLISCIAAIACSILIETYNQLTIVKNSYSLKISFSEWKN